MTIHAPSPAAALAPATDAVPAAVVRPWSATVRGLELRGTVYLPASGGGPLPTAVLHHGFGNQRTEGFRSFVQLGRAFAAQGFCAVTVDRAGHGESAGEFADTTVSGDVVDSLEVLEQVCALPEVDPDDLHLVGMSMGSVVASVVAAETPRAIRSLTMWSPAASFVDEIRAGTLQGRRYDEVATTGYFDFYGLALGPAFFPDARGFDVYGRARGYTGPVRVLAGGDDALVPARYAEHYRDVFPGPVELSVVAGADHGWSTVPLRAMVVSETVTFAAAHARTAAVTR